MANNMKDMQGYADAKKKEIENIILAGTVEVEYQSKLKETVRLYKSKRDITSSLEKVQLSLVSGTAAIKDKLGKLSEKLNKNVKGYKEYNKVLKYNNDRLTLLGKKNKKNTTQIDNYRVRIKALTSMQKKYSGSTEKMEEEIKKLSEVLADSEKKTKEFASEMEKLNSTLDVQVGTWEDLEAVTGAYIKQQEHIIDLSVKNNKISEEEAILAKEKLKDFKNIASIRSGIKEKTPEVQREEEARGKAKKAVDLVNLPKGKGKSGELIAQEMGSQTGKMKSNFGSLIRGRGGLFGGIESARGLQESIKHYKALKGAALGSGAGAKLLGGNIKMLGLALEGLSKANIFLMIAGMVGKLVAQLYDGVRELDAWRKEYNKTFMSLYGPTTAMGNVKGTIKEFTNAVFDMNRNLSMGLKSEDIMGLFTALSSGGMTIGTVAGKFGSYDKAIRESFKLSKDFGVGLDEMGSMISDQMTNMQSSLGEVKKSFSAMSYDASIAGIQSQKFYQAVYTATSSLGMYGNYLDDASNKLKNYIKTGAVGFDDAAKQTQSMADTFKNMSLEQAGALANMAGGLEEFRKIYADQLKKREEMLVSYTKEETALESRRGDMGEKEYLAAQEAIALKIRKVNGQIADLKNITADETGLAMLSHTQYLTDQSQALFVKVMKEAIKKGMTIFGGAGPAFEEMLKHANFTAEAINTMKADFLTFSDAFTKIADNSALQESLKKLGPETVDTIIASMETAQTLGNWESFSKTWGKTFEDAGTTVAQLMYQMETNAEGLKKVMKGGKESLGGNYNDFVMDAYSQMNKITNPKVKGKSPDSGRLDDIVDATRTIDDLTGIGKENIKYALSSNKITEVATAAAIATAKGVFDISGMLAKHFTKIGERKSEEEFKAFKGSRQGLESKQKMIEAANLTVEVNKKISEGMSEDDPGILALQEKIKSFQTEVKKMLTSQGMEERFTDMSADAGTSWASYKNSLGMAEGNIKNLKSDLNEETTDVGKKELNDKIAVAEDKLSKIKANSPRSLKKEDIEKAPDLPRFKENRKIWDDFKIAQDKNKKEQQYKSDFYNNLWSGIKKSFGYTPKDVAPADAPDAASPQSAFGFSPMGDSSGSGIQVQAPININVASMNGDVNEIARILQPAVEQMAKRAVYDAQKK